MGTRCQAGRLKAVCCLFFGSHTEHGNRVSWKAAASIPLALRRLFVANRDHRAGHSVFARIRIDRDLLIAARTFADALVGAARTVHLGFVGGPSFLLAPGGAKRG